MNYESQNKWRLRNRDKYNKYQRELMRERARKNPEDLSDLKDI